VINVFLALMEVLTFYIDLTLLSEHFKGRAE